MNKVHLKNDWIKRYIFFSVSVFIIFGIFIYRMIDWQIINADYYKERANSSSIYFIKTDPVRGEILDSLGEPLAVNDTGYKVLINRLLIEKDKENDTIINAVDLIESLGDSYIDILPIFLNENEFYYKEDKESQIKCLKSSLNLSEDSSAAKCIEELMHKYKIDNNISKKNILVLCSVKYNMEKNGVYFSKNTPYVLADNISEKTVNIILEKSDYLKGVKVQASLKRKYVNGEVAPHIIGYTGFMSSEEYEKRKDTYSMDSKIGKTGIESVYEDFLKGTGGKRMIQVSREGQVIGTSEKEPSAAGNTVFLTISSKIQKAANESLKRNVEKAQSAGTKDCKCAAAVALDVNNFSVLAAATYPSYDLTRFMEDKLYYGLLANDKSVPLLNRAFSGAYAPGSIYKPLVACAALEEGKITPDETIFCGGSFNYYSGYKLHCMGFHRNASLKTAVAKSCNVYFAELGRRLGADCLASWARKFGIGVKTGVEIGESKGVLAGPEHSQEVGAKWYESGSSQAAIGQSDNMFTPLQLATYTATIANGGTRYKTHLVSKITDYSRQNLVKEFGPEIIEENIVSKENLDAVKSAMREVTLSGTARDFSNYPVAIGAKTGTAQNSGSDHTTFVCFAPFEKPEIAVAVVIEHGKSGMLSKNVARDIMNAYFGFEN